MKYFLHDTNSFQDEKISQLFMKYGFEGIGLFYTLLEKIAMQEKPIKTVVLKRQLFVGKRLEKCWEFMEEIGIIRSSNGETFNERILSYSEKFQIKKEKNKERISQWRENHSDEKNVTRYETVTERVRNTRKVKVGKVKVLNRANALPVLTNGAPSHQEEYNKLVNDISNTDLKTVFSSIKDFIQGRHPDFAEPYVETWNIIADRHGLEKVVAINDFRRKKVRIRSQEPEFDYFTILASIRQNREYQGENKSEWKVTFNYVIDSPKNYISIIEKYKKP